jgi:hypothetical protein
MAKSTQAMLMRNKLGSLILANAPEEAIQAQRVALASVILEKHVQEALDAGVKPGSIAYIAKKLAGAK